MQRELTTDFADFPHFRNEIRVIHITIPEGFRSLRKSSSSSSIRLFRVFRLFRGYFLLPSVAAPLRCAIRG
jgi:hypothetical protein